MEIIQEIEVLLVEDNPQDADLAKRAFRKKNLANHLHWVEDGEEALDFLFRRGRYADRSQTRNPKVVMLDLKLPKVDGLEVLETIKKDERTKSIPVVVVTSSREDPDIERAYALGANSYVVKPIDFDQFAEAMINLGYYWLLINQPPTRDGASQE
ncbi:MAG: response regulator [Treponema sp.]|nr:response regulator [Treponema sp.]